MKRLRDTHRPKFKQLFGTLLTESEAVAQARRHSGQIVTVGDVSTFNLTSAGVKVAVAVVDYRREREALPEHQAVAIRGFKAKTFTAKNPAGNISREAEEALVDAFRNARAGGASRVEIDGEEDLLLLPCVLLADDDALLFYGQPKEGIVMVVANDAAKRHMANALAEAFENLE